MIRKLIVLIFVFSFFKANLFAIEPDIFVQSTVNRASKLLSEDISKEEKIKELQLIAKDTVDIKGIGFYTIGAARKNLNNALMSPSFEFKTDANSSFCVLAKLKPSIIKSLINGFSGSFVNILQSILISGLSVVPFKMLLTIV